ncbi:MAG: LemA family protein [Nitrospirae bacterium]|nr:MAG: LemA family protein [Nitrospirota bacterium]
MHQDYSGLTFILVAGGVVLIVAICLYNYLVRVKNQVYLAISSIDVFLKQRFDVLPNLVDVARRYMEYEKEILKELIEMRTAVMKKDRPPEDILADEKKSTALLRRLFAVAEGYPELKASKPFIRIQDALMEIETQIAAARRAFSAAVTDYNNALEMFPTSCVAAILGYKKFRWFEAEDHEREKIDISDLW